MCTATHFLLKRYRESGRAGPCSAAAPFAAQEGVNGEAPAAEDAGEAEGAGGLDLKKKKKKKRRDKGELEGLEEPEEVGEGDGEGDSGRTPAGLPWDGTDRDYSYEELLGAPRPWRLCGVARRFGSGCKALRMLACCSGTAQTATPAASSCWV